MAHENINRNIKNNAFYMINLFNQKKEQSPNKKISITLQWLQNQTPRQAFPIARVMGGQEKPLYI